MDSSLVSALVQPQLLTPLLYLLAALYCHVNRRQGMGRAVQLPAILALCAAFVAVLAAGLDWWPISSDHVWVSGAVVSYVMLLLISFVGLIIVRYSFTYLQAEPGLSRYYVHLFMVLAAVAITVISNHLLVFLAGWIAISLCLHALLRFYPDRPRAALADHKKFLFARVAELCLFCAFVLLRLEHGTWHIDTIVQAYGSGTVGWAPNLAAALIAAAALIKCAQLPVHGWLMQVVEAPTPVSALLHAGVVNMGGYLLILFGPLLMASLWAQALILLVAGASTVLAALSMVTRVSIKVKLAWSTCAQMGFMLIECALGLFELALLHMVAHSCYKAYAFLNSGSAVHVHRFAVMAPEQPAGAVQWVTGTALGVLPALALYALFGGHGPFSVWLLLGLAFSVIIVQRSSRAGAGSLLQFMGFASGVLLLYGLQKLVFSQLVVSGQPALGVWADVWLGFLFVLLYGGHIVLVCAGDIPVKRRLQRWLFAGLYLDEWSSRITLKLMPLRLPVQSQFRQPDLVFAKKVS